MKIKAVLFDLDGVLIDSCDWHYGALNRALKEIVGYEIDYPTHLAYYDGRSTYKKLNTLRLRGIITPDQEEAIWEAKQKYTVEMIGEVSTDLVKVEMVRRLRLDGYRIGVVSNAIRDTTEMICKGLKIYDFLDVVLSNEDFGSRIKPDPYPYLLASERIHTPIERCLVVEDKDVGVLSAERAGAKVMRVENSKEVNYESVHRYLELQFKGKDR